MNNKNESWQGGYGGGASSSAGQSTQAPAGPPVPGTPTVNIRIGGAKAASFK